MTSYKRRDRSYYRSNIPTVIQINWSMKYDSYALKFMDTHHFQEMQPIMNLIKQQPYGDWLYESDTKIWYFKESLLAQVRTLIDAFITANIFTLDFQEKPNESNRLLGKKDIPIETYFLKFEQLTGEDIRKYDYVTAKKLYRRICYQYHPDHNPNVDAGIMSSVNEVWSELENKHFKVRQEIQYDM